MHFSASIIVGGALASTAVARSNGFGKTPLLGFNTYNDVGCSPNDTYVRNSLNALKSSGLLAAGYSLFQIDCGWQSYNRQSNGSITYDASVFPNGIKPLSDLAISLGFKWGMYTDQGLRACDTTAPPRPGSLGYEKQDALMFAAWNSVYVKVDNCYIDGKNNAPKDPRTDFPARFRNMTTALDSVGIKGMLVCQWGTPYQSPTGLQGPAEWTPPLSTSYRVSDDIAQGWTNVQRIMNQAINVNQRNLSSPGQYADLDLLEVGNPGMTFAEQQSHFAIWAGFKSALMVSTSITKISKDTLSILTNKPLIAVNQDSLGRPAKLVERYSNDFDYFAGPLANGDMFVLLVDQSNKARTLTADFSKLGISSATVTNLWTGQSSASGSKYSYAVSAHGSAPLRLSKIVQTAPVTTQYTYVEAESGAISNGANVQSCTGCSGGKKIGYLSQDATLTLSNIRTSRSSMDAQFDFINGEIGYLAGGTNVRGATVRVNNGAAVNVNFPISGYNWDVDVYKSFLVPLSGFVTNGPNTVVISGLSSVSQFGPDLDRIGFQV